MVVASGLGNDQALFRYLINQSMFLVDALDHPPDKSPRRGSGFPTPLNGSRRISSIIRNKRFANFGSVYIQN